MLLVFDLDDTLYGCTGQMKEATKWEDAKHIVPFPGVIELLSSFPAEKILLSRETDAGLQDIKIDALRIRDYFSRIYLCRKGEEKRDLLEIIKQDYSSEDIWVVGDRIDSEIQYGNEFGMNTVWLRHGKYKDMAPQHEHQQARYTITEFSQLSDILRGI